MIRYAITGSDYLPGDAERWVADDVDFVQLRAKTVDTAALTQMAQNLIGSMGGKMKLLVNGRVDVAMAVGATGVHLTARPEEMTPAQVRQVFAGAVVSVSCHTLAEVERARDGGADLILFGPVFEKRVEGEVVVEGVGLEMLRRACETAGAVKVLALGGVTEVNASRCVEAGAAGVAGIRLFG